MQCMMTDELWRRQYLRYCFNMHVKDMWLWATRKHGSGHRRFWRVCSWNVASAAASWKQNLHILHHLHRFLRLSTSILIHPENTGWRWLKKIFTGLLVQVAKRFQVSVSSGECVGDPEWTPTRSSPSSIVVSTNLSPYRQSTLYFRIIQVIQHGRR